ncbi:MAG: Crp/Fnr family transcriptional regulator [Cyanobacteria bacterium P01_E01_bin.6]
MACDYGERLKEPSRDGFVQQILYNCFAGNWPSSAQLKAYSPQQVIFRLERNSDSMYFLLAGAVKLSSVRANGDEYATALMPKNSIFGAFPFLKRVNSIHSGQAIALAPSILLSINVEQIERMLIDNPEFVEALLHCLTARNLESRWFVNLLATKHISARLEQFLVLLCQYFGVPQAKKIQIDLALTNQDIAQLIGGVLDTVTMELGRLQDSGYISLDKGRIVVHRLEQLLARCKLNNIRWNEHAPRFST